MKEAKRSPQQVKTRDLQLALENSLTGHPPGANTTGRGRSQEKTFNGP